MNIIPCDQRRITDEEVFSAFNLDYPGLEGVKAALALNDTGRAKRELIAYFETRTNVRYFYDYRKKPLTPVETDESPWLFQSSMGLKGSLKEFCLFAGEKLMQHIYVRPGRERKELDLGPSYENLPHFNCFADQGKKHRTTLDIFVRGVFMEYLSILYHETKKPEVLAFTKEFLRVFQENYPMIVECTNPDASHFSMLEERDVMSAGWLVLNYCTLLYTRIPYDLDTESAFEIIRCLWFLGIQFRRFDADVYRKYNHHMWERGLVPFLLGTLFPEIPDFADMRERGADVVRMHIRDDFNEEGGYSEHTITYWCGAALMEMISRGIYLAELNDIELLDPDTRKRVAKSFDVLALISAPGNSYPSLGDNGGSQVDEVLKAGAKSLGNLFCREILEYRTGKGQGKTPDVPLDYCSDRTGFFCSRSSWKKDADYILMSVKVNGSDTGHNHMDLLSLFVNIHGQEFIGEPYARAIYHTAPVGSELRGYLYNMASHNTVLAFGEPIQPDCIYASKWGVIRPDTPVEVFVSEERGCYVKASHDAYTHSRHIRKILSCRGKGFLIRDELMGGGRLDKESIQRWHLFPDVCCKQRDEHSLLLEKNGAKALLLWSGSPRLRLWQKQELYPSIVKNKEEIAVTVDACFKADSFSPAGGLEAVSLDLMILDVTEGIPELEDVDVLCETLLKAAEDGKVSQALESFGQLLPFGQ